MKTLFLFGLRQWRDVDYSDRINIFTSPPVNYYVFGSHAPYSEEYAQRLTERQLQGICVTRDLRDTAVSFTHWMEHLTTHPYRDFFMALPTWNERLRYIILGVPHRVPNEEWFPSLADRYAQTVAWRSHPHVLSVRFEDLVGSEGGGSIVQQLATIHAIAEHIGLSLTDRQARHVSQRLWGVQQRRFRQTYRPDHFRKGVIGDWRHNFTPQNVTVAKQVFGDILIQEGYEEDDDWSCKEVT